MRQWKALMRKNFINWKRQPKCSFFEICCPAMCMFLLVILRNVITIETLDFSALLKVRAPVTPAFMYDSTTNAWVSGKDEFQAKSTELNDFFKYASYPSQQYYKNFSNYNMELDPAGPLAFLPSDCLKINSFQLPRVEMPVIAVVGEMNEATTMMRDYLKTLYDFQVTDPYLQLVIEQLYGSKATYPEWEFQYFDSQDDLFAWTSAENYTFTDGLKGVCFGF